MHRWIASLLALSISTGCVFGASDEPDNDPDNDAGVPLDLSDSADEGTPDPTDASDPRDSSGGADSTRPDQGPTADTDSPDMRPEGPFEIVRTVQVNDDDEPTRESPAEVARFRNGFLAGFVDIPAAQAHIGWYTEDEPVAIDTQDIGTTLASFDLAGDAEFGYATLVKLDQQKVVKFRESDGGLANDVDIDDAGAGVAYEEMSVAMEGGLAYIAQTRNFSGTHLDISVWGVDESVGIATERLNYDVDSIDSIGGGAVPPNRRFLVAGHTDGQYGLNEFRYIDGTGWTNEAFSCGQASSSPRVTPVREEWVLAFGTSPQGRAWRAVKCGESPVGAEISIPSPGEVVDFDVAEESVGFDNPAVTWLQGGEVWVGFLAIDPEGPTAEIVNGWRIPGATGIHVRTAYNPDRGTMAVAVQEENPKRVTLYFLKPGDLGQ